MNACSNIGAFILEMSFDTPFVVFCKFDLREAIALTMVCYVFYVYRILVRVDRLEFM